MTLPTLQGIAIYPPGATFGPRSMTDFEFVWVLEGHAEYQVDGVAIDLPEQAIALCRPGTRDAFRWDLKRPTRHAFCHFGVIAAPRSWPAVQTWPAVRTAGGGDDVLRVLFRHLLTWGPQADPLLRELTVAHMLASYVTGQSAPGHLPPDVQPQAVELAMRFIHAQLDTDAADPITLAALAEAAGVTREHLCRVFQGATGRGPVETARLARLDRAAVAIARSNLPLKTIAETFGFSSAFHLSRRFSEAFGVSPRHVRQQVAAGKLPPQPLLSRTFASR